MKTLVRLASITLAIAAIAYFAVHAKRTLSGHEMASLATAPSLAGLVLLIVLFGSSIATNAIAWSWQLRALGQPHRLRTCLAILASTQFGKYMPGNVGQHIGRIALARRAGISMSAALLTALYEVVLAIVASAHIAGLALVLAPPAVIAGNELFQQRWLLVGGATLFALVGLVLAPRAAAWLLRRRAQDSFEVPLQPENLQLPMTAMIASYAMYVCSLSLVGLGLWGMSLAIGNGGAMPGPIFFIGAFTTSWIAGFVVPGAPAGLGVREVVLTAWLAGALPPATAVLLVVALRIATTIADLVNFLWGSAVLVRNRQQQP